MRKKTARLAVPLSICAELIEHITIMQTNTYNLRKHMNRNWNNIGFFGLNSFFVDLFILFSVVEEQKTQRD